MAAMEQPDTPLKPGVGVLIDTERLGDVTGDGFKYPYYILINGMRYYGMTPEQVVKQFENRALREKVKKSQEVTPTKQISTSFMNRTRKAVGTVGRGVATVGRRAAGATYTAGLLAAQGAVKGAQYVGQKATNARAALANPSGSFRQGIGRAQQGVAQAVNSAKQRMSRGRQQRGAPRQGSAAAANSNRTPLLNPQQQQPPPQRPPPPQRAPPPPDFDAELEQMEANQGRLPPAKGGRRNTRKQPRRRRI